MSDGAQTPEELETLFEDSLLLRDGMALNRLFDSGAAFVAHDVGTARGDEIARLALATWNGDATYLADPRWVVQAHDIALIVTGPIINVARRGLDGVWRYAIVFVDEQSKGKSNDRRFSASSDNASGCRSPE